MKSDIVQPSPPHSMSPTVSKGLTAPPHQFFMCWRDVGFWLRSARADHRLVQLQQAHGTQKAFDLLYAETADPWGFMVPHYRYQRLKYEKMLALLPARAYASALDVGCGLGAFTRLLAPYVQEVVGMELSGVAVAQAQRLSSNYPNVQFEQAGIEDLNTQTARRFDLIVLADVLYYLDPLPDDRLQSLITQVVERLEPGGVLMLANHFFFDLDPQSRRVRHLHAAFCQDKSLALLQEQRYPFFLASVLSKSI